VKEHFNMNITDASKSLTHTLAPESRRLPFFLQSVGSFYARAGYLTDREGMDSYLLLYTLSGCGSVAQRQSSLLLPVNHAVLISCREHHRYETWLPDTGEPIWNFLYAHFDGCGIEPYFDRLNGRSLQALYLTDEIRQQLLDQFTSLFDLAGQPQADYPLSILLQQILVGLVLGHSAGQISQRPQQHEETLESASRYLKEHCHEVINLDQLARQYNLSKYHFSRLFRQYTGHSPYAWLISQRVDLAKNLLRTSRLSLPEIAGRCGFNDFNHFIRTFRQATGITPRRYRQENWLI